MASPYRPRHLSVSAIELYVKCPAAYRERYVEKKPTPPSVPMSWGTAFHRALEAGHNGHDPESAWLRSWNAMRDECAGRGQVFLPSKSHGLMLLDEYTRRGLMVPGKPEVKFSLKLPAGTVPVPILGYIDAVLPEEMREYKTSRGGWWTETKARTANQSAVYGWAHQRLYSRRVPMRYVIFGTRVPTVTEYVVEHSPEIFRVFEQVAELVWQGIVEEKYDGCGTCDICRPKVERAAGAEFSLDGLRSVEGETPA